MKKKILIYYPGLKPRNIPLNRYSDSPNRWGHPKQIQIDAFP
jgi:hypothetical protein